MDVHAAISRRKDIIIDGFKAGITHAILTYFFVHFSGFSSLMLIYILYIFVALSVAKFDGS